MNLRPRRLSVSAALLVFSVPLLAQTYTPQSILFTGAPAFDRAALLATSGLTPGKTVTLDDVNAGAQRLVDTGFFLNIGILFNGQSISYKLTPMTANSLLPAVYDNFPWWSPSDLAAELHKRHPLFTTLVPQSGKMQDALIDDLTAMVAAKGFTVTITATPGGSDPHNTKVDCVQFTITDPPVLLRNLRLDGLPPEIAKSIEPARRARLKQDFTVTLSPALLHHDIAGTLQDSGFLDAVVSPLQYDPPQLADGALQVDASLAVTLGPRYTISQVNWPGSPELTADDFASLSLLQPSHTPSLTALEQTRIRLEHAMELRGYMAAKTSIEPHTDPAAHLVSYTVTVNAGPRYTFHGYTLAGVDGFQNGEFRKAWTLRPGDPYSLSYVLGFLKANAAALHSLDGCSLGWKQFINDDKRLVDLQLVMVCAAPGASPPASDLHSVTVHP